MSRFASNTVLIGFIATYETAFATIANTARMTEAEREGGGVLGDGSSRC